MFILIDSHYREHSIVFLDVYMKKGKVGVSS